MDSSSSPASCQQLAAAIITRKLLMNHWIYGFHGYSVRQSQILQDCFGNDKPPWCIPSLPELRRSCKWQLQDKTLELFLSEYVGIYSFVHDISWSFSHLCSTNHRLPNTPNRSKERFTPLLQCISLSNRLVKISLKSITALKLVWQQRIIHQLGPQGCFFVTPIYFPHRHGTQVGFNQSFFRLLASKWIPKILVGVPTSPLCNGNLIHICGE